MSARKTEQETAVRHPRETPDLFGHREAEMALLNAYRSGRIPHAWLIGGTQGIGKATLAYRMARFVLANRNPLAPSVQRAQTLAVDPSDSVACQITAEAHGGLLVLERGLNDRGTLRTVITVDETRETISFFGSTAAVDGWRICIVDTVDELNPNAANALLKISRRAAAAIAVSSGQSLAGPRAADDSVPLPQIAVAAARDRRRNPCCDAGDRYHSE